MNKTRNSVLKQIFIALIFSSVNNLVHAGANMWRANASEVKQGSLGSVIEDKKYLQATLPASSGYYLFSETGAGVKPLVLVGAPSEILAFFAERKESGIENQIKELPDIYMGMTSYIPGKRFTGLFPVNDFMQQFVENVTKLIPGAAPTVDGIGHTLNDVAGNFGDFVDYLKKIKRKINQDTQKGNGKIYMKFSYIQEPGMKKIGENKVEFKNLLREFYLDLKPLPALPGKPLPALPKAL